MLSSEMHQLLTQRQRLVGARLHTTVIQAIMNTCTRTLRHNTHKPAHSQSHCAPTCTTMQAHKLHASLQTKRKVQRRMHIAVTPTHPNPHPHARTRRRGRFLHDSQSLDTQGGCACTIVQQRKMISCLAKGPSALATSWCIAASLPPRWVPLLVMWGCQWLER